MLNALYEHKISHDITAWIASCATPYQWIIVSTTMRPQHSPTTADGTRVSEFYVHEQLNRSNTLYSLSITYQGTVKGSLSLYLTNQTLQHEDVWGSGSIGPRIFGLGTTCRWVVSFIPLALYPPPRERSSGTPGMGPITGMDNVWTTKILPLWRFRILMRSLLFSNLPNPSSRTKAQGSTKPLRNEYQESSWGQSVAGA
jgi:hypothetical protein